MLHNLRESLGINYDRNNGHFPHSERLRQRGFLLPHQECVVHIDGPPIRNLEPTPEAGLIDKMIAEKQRQGLTLHVVMPARNEAARIGESLDHVTALRDAVPLVDNITVVNDAATTDETAEIAFNYGADVMDGYQELHNLGLDEVRGKGVNLWLATTDILRKTLEQGGDPNKVLVAFVDADGVATAAKTATIFRSLVQNADKNLALPFVQRLTQQGIENGAPVQGGRVTENLYGPLIDTLFDECIGLPHQLAGLYAGRLSMLQNCEVPSAWGVETAYFLETILAGGLDNIHDGINTVAYEPLGIYHQKGHQNHGLGKMRAMVAQQAVYSAIQHGAFIDVRGKFTPRIGSHGLPEHIIPYKNTYVTSDAHGHLHASMVKEETTVVYLPPPKNMI